MWILAVENNAKVKYCDQQTNIPHAMEIKFGMLLIYPGECDTDVLDQDKDGAIWASG